MICPHPDCKKPFTPVIDPPTLCPHCLRKLNAKAVAGTKRGIGGKQKPALAFLNYRRQ